MWIQALEELIEAARFGHAPLLIHGESGTGKEMAARLVHTLDPRPDKGQLVVVDCTTIVPTLAGSELFGHAKGAFTGALSPRRGALALADGGTLFLDEIGELPLTLQSELLRVIQEGTYKPVGSDKWERTRFRLVTATNRDLAAMQSNGAFRADLYHRVSAIAVRLPALRERKDDIAVLARHFLAEHVADPSSRLAPAVETLSPEPAVSRERARPEAPDGAHGLPPRRPRDGSRSATCRTRRGSTGAHRGPPTRPCSAGCSERSRPEPGCAS